MEPPAATSLQRRLQAWMVNNGSRYAAIAIWIFLQSLVFILAFVNYKVSDNFKGVRALFGTPLFWARAAALNLHVSSALVLFPVCRNLISFLRTTALNRVIPFDENISFHKLVGWTIVFFSVVHTVAHVFNYATLVSANPDGTSDGWAKRWFTNGPGWTGNVMLVCLALIAGTAIKRVRRKNFEAFWYTHHLFIPFFAIYAFHGAYCVVQPDREPKCANAGAFWKYWIASGTIYLFERILREWRARKPTYITKVVLHPSKVVEIQMRREGFEAKSGQYIFINCPEVSLLQWHPFTLTSAPEEDYVSVHIRVVGDFTRALADKLGCGDADAKKHDQRAGPAQMNKLLPRVLIDGPYGSASEDVFKYEVAVLVGAGIGVTPFASVLKSIWYRVNYPTRSTRLRKVYFFWVCRDYQAFEWFQDLIKAIEDEDINHFIEIHVYLTGRLKPDQIGNIVLNDDEGHQDAVTGLRAPTHYGRPNLDQVFGKFARTHPDTEIGVFFCGPKPMSKQLEIACNKWTQAEEEGGCKFIYNKENF